MVEKHNLCFFWEISILMFSVKIGEMEMQISGFNSENHKNCLQKYDASTPTQATSQSVYQECYPVPPMNYQHDKTQHRNENRH